jgi:hypothetical protein
MTRCVSCVKFYRPFVDFDIGERAGSGVQLKESKRMKTRASVDSEDLLVQNLYTPLILSGRSWKNGSFNLFIIVIVKVDSSK